MYRIEHAIIIQGGVTRLLHKTLKHRINRYKEQHDEEDNNPTLGAELGKTLVHNKYTSEYKQQHRIDGITLPEVNFQILLY